MIFIYNNPPLKNKRKNLRKNQSEAEKIIWQKLRANQLDGLKFFRQYSVDPFILDFYCPKIRLAVEIDGGQHAEEDHLIYDEKRKRYLQNKNIAIIRFWNNEVIKNTKGVLEKLREEIVKLNNA